MENKEIAKELGIGVRTVKQNINRIADKLLIDADVFHVRVRIVWLLRGRYA